MCQGWGGINHGEARGQEGRKTRVEGELVAGTADKLEHLGHSLGSRHEAALWFLPVGVRSYG